MTAISEPATPRPVEYNGARYRGVLETPWAVFFTSLGFTFCAKGVGPGPEKEEHPRGEGIEWGVFAQSAPAALYSGRDGGG